MMLRMDRFRDQHRAEFLGNPRGARFCLLLTLYLGAAQCQLHMGAKFRHMPNIQRELLQLRFPCD